MLFLWVANTDFCVHSGFWHSHNGVSRHFSSLLLSLRHTKIMSTGFSMKNYRGFIPSCFTNQSCHCSEGETFAGSHRCPPPLLPGEQEQMCLRTNNHPCVYSNTILWQNKPVPVRKSRGERVCRTREPNIGTNIHPSPASPPFPLPLLCPSSKVSKPSFVPHLNLSSGDAPGCCHKTSRNADLVL